MSPDSPSNLARLGDDDVDASLFRTVDVPAGTTALTIRGLLWVVTNESNPGTVYDTLHVSIYDANADTWLEELARFTNQDDQTGWQSFELPASETYAGQTITLDFYGDNDVGGPTRFYLDSLAVDARLCP